MSASKELFIRMSEEEYMAVPHEVRQRHLQSKIYYQDSGDFEELIKDPSYSKLHKEYKQAKGALEERAYQLRELKRKNN